MNISWYLSKNIPVNWRIYAFRWSLWRVDSHKVNDVTYKNEPILFTLEAAATVN